MATMEKKTAQILLLRPKAAHHHNSSDLLILPNENGGELSVFFQLVSQ